MPTLPRIFNFCPQEKIVNVTITQLYVLKIYCFAYYFFLPHSEILVLIQQRQELRELREE
jgi:hypothetical protein